MQYTTPQEIASLVIGDSTHSLSQTELRHEIVSKFGVKPGDKVLEVGCGQGDTTVVLASLVGENGHVTAIDPAPLDYGSPHTLGQAQAHLSSGALGSRITWIQDDPIRYLSSLHANGSFDLIVFVTSLWYFSSPKQIADTISLAGMNAKRVGIAEFSLTASAPPRVEQTAAHTSPSLPHVLASLTQAALEVRKPSSESNIRTVLGPQAIIDLATSPPDDTAPLILVEQGVLVPSERLGDGYWETSHISSPKFILEIDETLGSGEDRQREKALVHALRDATLAAARSVGGPRNVRMQDVWWGTFAPKRK